MIANLRLEAHIRTQLASSCQALLVIDWTLKYDDIQNMMSILLTLETRHHNITYQHMIRVIKTLCRNIMSNLC